MLAGRGTGRGIPLLTMSRSIALQGTSLLGSDSTGFCVLGSIAGLIEMLFSSNFPGNPGPGPEPFFTA